MLKNFYTFKKSLSQNIVFIIIIGLPYIKFLIEHFIFDFRLRADNLGSYHWYQYYYNFFLLNFNFPSWIDYLDGGLPSVLPLHIETSVFSYIFIILGSFLKLNPYFSFISLMIFFQSLVLYGIYLNLDLKQNKKFIFFILSILLLISNNFLLQSQALLGISLSLFTFYYSKKFVKNLNFSSLFRLGIFLLVSFYILPYYLNILICFYFPLLIFIFYFFHYHKTNFKKKFFIFYKSISTKHILYFIFLSFCFLTILQYEKDIYSIQSVGRLNNYKLSYDKYLQSMQYFNFKEMLAQLTYFPFVNQNFNSGPVILTFFVLSIFMYFSKYLTNLDILFFLFLFLITFVISIPLDFYFTHKYLLKFLYNFPFLNYTRYSFYYLIYFKPFLLISAGYAINFIIRDKISKKIYWSIFLIFLFYYTEFLFSFNKNSVDTKIWYEFFFGIIFLMIFIYLYVFIFKKKFIKIFFLLIIIINTPYYLSNFLKNDYTNPYFAKKLDNINFDTQSHNLIDYCLKQKDILDLYNDYGIYFGSRHNQIFLNTQHKPCNVIFPQRLRGSLKNYQLYKDNAKASFFDDNLKQIGNLLINGLNYSIYDFYSDDSSVNVKKINNNSFKIELNEVNRARIKISYSKYWSIYEENQDEIILFNDSGYVGILNKSPSIKSTVIIIYKNFYQIIIVYFNIILGFLLLLIILYKIFKNTRNTN